MLILSNADVEKVLRMEATIAALEEAYLQLAAGEAVCRPRIDIRIPTRDPAKSYQWGTMEGGSTAGYFAIRMKSDIIYETRYHGALTQEKYCSRPGLYCGLVLLTCIETGEPLAILNDGVLQHMRVGADGGIGVKYPANEQAEVVGMLGSGGMARAHMQAFNARRPPHGEARRGGARAQRLLHELAPGRRVRRGADGGVDSAAAPHGPRRRLARAARARDLRGEQGVLVDRAPGAARRNDLDRLAFIERESRDVGLRERNPAQREGGQACCEGVGFHFSR